MPQEYEAELAVTRDEAATALRQLADGVAAGSVSIYADAGPVAVDIPDDLTFIAELEQFQGTVELEAELEWQTDRGAIREPDAEAEPAAESTSEQAEGDSETTESASEPDESTSRPAASEPIESAADLVGPATDEATGGDEPVSKATFELFRDAADEWRWRLRHRNGNVIADSGEGYDRKAGAIKGLESVKSNAPLAVVEVEKRE